MVGKVKESKSVDFVNNRVKTSTRVEATTDEDIRALLVYQIRRLVTNLYKDQLTLLEDIQQEHNSSLNRVKDLVSEDFIDLINFLDSDKYGYYRKKVLDSGNETSREIERLLENFEILLRR
jgi:vesicle coat complex subunit